MATRLSEFRIAVRRGVTLVELMISMLILTIVCLAWLEIIGIQSARKEARRREAVERLSGMMDAFMECNKANYASDKKKEGRILSGSYVMHKDNNKISFETLSDEKVISPIFTDDFCSIGYRLRVVNSLPLQSGLWECPNRNSGDWTKKKWLIGELYNHDGDFTASDKPFFVLPVCLWLKK